MAYYFLFSPLRGGFLSDQRLCEGRGGSQVLGRGVHEVGKRIVVDERGIDIGEDQDEGEHAEDDDVQLVAEEDAEDAAPVGIARRGDLLGLEGAVVDKVNSSSWLMPVCSMLNSS